MNKSSLIVLAALFARGQKGRCKMKWLNVSKIRFVLFVFVPAMLLIGGRAKADVIWTQKADMPTARWIHSSSVVDGKIYVIGGASSEPAIEAVWPVEVYDPITDTWTQKADIPTGRAFLSASVVDGKIYAIGGCPDSYKSYSVVEEYDPVTDTWTRKADMPTARAALSTSVVDGKIYAIGGMTSTNNRVGLSTVEVYDPATGTWTSKAAMPTPRYALSTSVVDGQIYAIGGASQTPGEHTVEAYDPATDTWTRKADMPTARRNFSTSVVCGKIYAIGGWLNSGMHPYSIVEVYEPAMNMWTKEADMPDVRACLSTSVVDGRIYAIGGTFQPHPCPALSTVYELTIGGHAPDFNGDEIVDINDLLILIEHWGQAEPSVDIAPPPCGDGIIDAKDLEVLMSYWQQEVLPVSLLAYWKFDETEGFIAADSAGDYDGTLNGNPVWKPTSGKVNGALQLDGVDDYVSTPFVLNPAAGTFSVFAWVKGGAPRQVIISQKNGVNWLLADPSAGKLMTELQSSGRDGRPLVSQTVITDGVWHRMGFVWDGSQRILYIDDVEVVKDTQASLAAATGGLYFGVGSNLSVGSFWSGLIDDVRIYNRAVSP